MKPFEKRRAIESRSISVLYLFALALSSQLFINTAFEPVIAQQAERELTKAPKSDAKQEKQKQQKIRTQKTDFAVAQAKKQSGAEAGVQLLESIITRIMNIPQVAKAVELNKTTGSQILAQNLKQQNKQSSQGVDYKLAIRPKESGKPYAPAAPALQMIAQAPKSMPSFSAISSGEISVTEKSFPLIQSARNSLPAQAGSYGSADRGREETDADAMPTADSWKGSTLTRIPIACKSDAQMAQPNKPGFWEQHLPKDAVVMAESSPNTSNIHGHLITGKAGCAGEIPRPAASTGEYPASRSSALPSYEEAKKKAPQLADSIGKFYGLSKQMDELQNPSEKKRQDIIARAIETGKDRAKTYNAPSENEIADDRPVIRDFRSASSPMRSGGPVAKCASEPAAAGGGKLSSKTAASKLEAEAGKEGRRAAEKTENGYMNNSSNRDKIALLPPNIATGTTLPLVSLGNSEHQVTQFLARSGSLTERKIRNWSVYTWSRPEAGGAESLQLFFRHGLLDAIRVYDPTLLAADFGVSPGDSLDNVKERFGEPAFLLTEPGSGTGGKNYIYPISQVGFQLARNSNESPRVVSVLIFSVK